MKSSRVNKWSFAALCILVLTGCSPNDQQAAPHKIVQGMAILSGAKKGFFVTDGQPTYHDWNAGAGNIAEPLEGADADSFQAFGSPKGAAALFARDRNHVYMARFYTPRIIEVADASSFELVTPDGLYAKDAKQVYFLGVEIPTAEPKTFEVLMYPFSQDQQQAFIGASPIPGVDRESWRPLWKGRTGDYWYRSSREVYPKERESVYTAGWSRDANAIYHGRTVEAGIDVETFEVLSNYYSKDKNQVYSRHYSKLAVVEDADPATFVVHKDVDNILTRGADAHDARSQYKDGKTIPPE